MQIFLAIILGGLFGFALNRVGATNPKNIINMLRLTDLTLMKTILFAIGTASLVLFIGLELGLFNIGHLSVKATYWGVLIGGVLLGTGFAIAGYCPGTSLTAIVAGRYDAIIFVIGGLLGAFAFSLSYDWFKQTGLMDSVKMTLADTGVEAYTGIFTFAPGWLVAVVLAAILIAVAVFLPKQLIKSAK